MKLILTVIVLSLAGCENVPITAAYTGAAAGHEFTAAYSSAGGAALVVKQK